MGQAGRGLPRAVEAEARGGRGEAAGEGIGGLLGLLVRLTVAPGDVVVNSDGAYPTFNFHVAGFGGCLNKVPYRNEAEDPQADSSEYRPRKY